MADDTFDDRVMLKRLQNGKLQVVGRGPVHNPIANGFLQVSETFYEMYLEEDD